MRAACNMSAQSWVKETSIYLDVGIEIVTGLSLLLDRPLCRLKGIRILIIRVDTSLLYISDSIHERQRIGDMTGLTLGYVCPSRSCRRSRTVLR